MALRIDHYLSQFVITELLPYQEIIRINTTVSWINKISINVTETDKNKGSIYVDGHERLGVVAYRGWFCDIWFENYLPHMLYFEGVDMKRVDPELKAGETDIVAVFHEKSYSELMKISGFVG